MFKLSTDLLVPYFVTYLSILLDLLLTEWVTRMRLGGNSVEDHPQLSHNRHPVDGARTGGCWFTVAVFHNTGTPNWNRVFL